MAYKIDVQSMLAEAMRHDPTEQRESAQFVALLAIAERLEAIADSLDSLDREFMRR